ncbi:MAG: PEGA domain-containing protein [Candidatus Buchananbacteria bacterium]|nr:PEGA domain-containing protein [Candidatus Buchananbacteria bacterium]
MKEKESQYKNIKLITTKNLGFRRLIYLFFITIFLIVTPLIILYTQGYRYNFKRGKVQKTGILIVSSIPKKADIYLNGKIIENDQTPTRIEKLLPADYEIKLSKEGYHDWTKKLQISENSTTFAEDVILWKNNLPIQLAARQIIDWLPAPDNKKIVFITEDRKVISLDIDTKEFNDIYQAGQYANPKILSWSNNGKKILIKSNNEYLIIEAERYYIKPTIISDNDYKLIKWDQNNDNLLYGLNNSGIWKIDLFTRAKKLVFDKAVDDFILNNDTIYYFYKDIIYRQKLVESKNPEIIDGVKCQGCVFSNYIFSKLILMNQESQELFIIDPELKNKTVKKEAEDISWLNQDTLLFYNNWEIWIYESAKKEPELITRIGAGIGEALWHPEGRHIIFTSDDKIKIIELDNRELRNMIELFSGRQINNLSINDRGDNIYFSFIISDKENVMELNIE